MSHWDTELAELVERSALAERMGGEERIARHRSKGRLTVRERVTGLVDSGSWAEVGRLAGTGTYGPDGALKDFMPANILTGRARIEGRRVVVAADDFTVRGGAADGGIATKRRHAEQMARDMRCPIVRLIDGTGGGGSIASVIADGRTYVPGHPDNGAAFMLDLGVVPVVSAALGSVAGLGAARVVASHVSIMVRESSQVFIAGPAIVEAGMGESGDSESLGGWEVCARAGTVDLVADSEPEALELIRRVLGYLPRHVWELPPRSAVPDADEKADQELRAMVPRNRRQPYDMRNLLANVVDEDSLLELGRLYGSSLICALARVNGYPVAVIAGNPLSYGGGMSGAAADKVSRFIDTADTFHLPIVHFVDQPGFVVGADGERSGTPRRGARLMSAVIQSKTPWASVLVRRVYGLAGGAHRPNDRYSFRVAWPSGDWGSLPVEGGLEVAYKRAIAAAGDHAEEERQRLLAQFEGVRSPFRTAEAFLVEDIIDPAMTRPMLWEWVEDAYEILSSSQLGPTARCMRP